MKELGPLLVSAPAIVALVIKGGIYLYARSFDSHNYLTRLYLLFLFALSVQNIAEIAHFFVLANGVVPSFQVLTYYAASIAALAFLLHLSIAVSWQNGSPTLARRIYGFGYVYAAALIVLIFSGEMIIAGFEQIGYTVTRIPGPWFSAFELFAFGICVLAIAFFSIGTFFQDNSASRARNALLLVAVLPIIIVVTVILILLHLGIKWLNASVILPFAITFFLLVSAYAIHQHRIFDIQLYVPWSKVRRRKTKFHEGIRTLISEIADLPTADELVTRLARTLRCPVTLLGPLRPLYSGSAAQRMGRMPKEVLDSVKEIVVAREISEYRPSLHNAMETHGVAAIVPFNVHSTSDKGWLLLGKHFDEQVYSSLDFRLVEELFGKMAELFVDRFVSMRAQLRTADRQIRTLRAEKQALQTDLQVLREQYESLRAELSERASGGADHWVAKENAAEYGIPPPITLLGRDKAMAQAMREEFPYVKTYVGLSSKTFMKAGPPEVLVCRVDRDLPELARKLIEWKSVTAALLYGDHVREFTCRHSRLLRGGLIEIVDNQDPSTVVIKRLKSLVHLRGHCYSTGDGEAPLIGQSPVFASYLQRLRFLARFSEPMVVCHGGDLDQFAESVRYLHRCSARSGKVIILNSDELGRRPRSSTTEDTIAITDIAADAESAGLQKLWEAGDGGRNRLVFGCAADSVGPGAIPPALKEIPSGFRVALPNLTQRKPDLKLLAYYFALQFNLRSPLPVTCDNDDIEAIAGADLTTLSALREATFARLDAKSEHTAGGGLRAVDVPTVGTLDRSLGELVADFEARIIRQTLDRCGGNKAKAARLLGVRANTLHYKLERYGIEQRNKKNGRRPNGQ